MNYEIPSYRAEREAGLAHAVRSRASVAFLAPLEPVEADAGLVLAIREAARAAIGSVPDRHDDDELFYMKDVLVTSGWNLNDDVFDRIETWQARHSSRDKPLNFRHDQADIIGHIVASQATDAAMAPLADDLAVDDLPDKFHIVNGSVIYRHIGDEARRQFIEKTIAEIKAGRWFVSMEALFRGFDYAVRGPDGAQHVVARNEQTAWLTKYLRAYQPDPSLPRVDPQLGSGSYVDRATGARYELGRLMRNLTFCGKGLVEKPGNPESIIFSSVSAFRPSYENSVYLNAGNASPPTQPAESPTMPDSNAEVLALQARLEELARANEGLVQEIAALKGKDVVARIGQLEAEVAAKAGQVASLTTQVEAVSASVATLTGRAVAAEAALAEAARQRDGLLLEKVRSSRLAILADKGATAEVAAHLVEAFASHDDAAFAATVDVLAPTWAKPPARPPVDPSAVLANAAVEPDPSLAIAAGPDADAATAANAVVVEFFQTNLLGRGR